MHRLLCAVALLVAALPLHAAEQAKLNTLTPKEVADGWILLFDGETTFGWSAADKAKWTVAGGFLAPHPKDGRPLMTTTEFQEFELSLEYRMKEMAVTDLVLGCDDDCLEDKKMMRGYHIPLQRWDVWCQFVVRVADGRCHVTMREYHFGKPPLEVVLRDKKVTIPRGHIALVGAGGVVFRNIKLRPINMKPLFNGKDLTGWKKYEGDKARSKSEFTVTKEGWLHLKNGPGDLQTVGQYDDFVLQLDCRSNGKHLNSGIFFRCRPGEYQQGYEAQINNNFNEEKPKEYTIEEYDPKTHELKGKKKVKFAAVDYGTGAIYRRMPARKQVSKDGEWFTMTVVAHGRHFATWVNGVQVVDWTDNRPLKDNARNGCRLEKGPISIQGHDPTTDLSFRNFRIAELPKMEKK
ncbi:MAG TPA: DUF1080 domain-containing protein [Gemmataceae bacterium]|nr:DUF1080 domain-containing protein [Gemmataceae bacterium]